MSIEFSLIHRAEFKLKQSKLLLGFEYEFELCSPFYSSCFTIKPRLLNLLKYYYNLSSISSQFSTRKKTHKKNPEIKWFSKIKNGVEQRYAATLRESVLLYHFGMSIVSSRAGSENLEVLKKIVAFIIYKYSVKPKKEKIAMTREFKTYKIFKATLLITFV